MGEILHSWKFRDKKDRGPTWYTLSFAVVIGLVVWGFITEQYGLSFVVLLISGVLLFIENNSEEEVIIKITTLGIYIGETMYEYTKIISYGIIYDKNTPAVLRIHLNSKTVNRVDLPIISSDNEKIKEILSKYIEENEKDNFSMGDKIIKNLKL